MASSRHPRPGHPWHPDRPRSTPTPDATSVARATGSPRSRRRPRSTSGSTDLTGKNGAFFVDQDTNNDGTDDNLFNLYAVTEPIASGPFEQVRFDCTPGAFIRPSDFDCTPANPSDTSGNPLNLTREQLDCRVTAVTSAGAAPAAGGP